MKGILILILAAAVGYLSYEYAYPVLANYVKFEKHKKEVAVAPAPPPVVKKKVAVVEAPKPKMEEPKPEPPKPMEPKPEPMPEMPKPVVDPNAFVAPVLPSLEERTENWTKLPASAFPRPVTIKRDLTLSMKMGANTASTQVKAGGTMIARGQDGLNILVSPTETSPMKASVALDDTNLKEILNAGYENWKVAYIASLKNAHEYRLAAAERAKNAPASSKGSTAKAGNDKPTKDKDGTYPLLIASMKSGQVTEIKPDAIKEWSDPVLEEGIWKVNVKYETMTMFGKFDTEAQAQIKNGVVEKWIYTGSGEVVP
jgi:hypothetical protein